MFCNVYVPSFYWHFVKSLLRLDANIWIFFPIQPFAAAPYKHRHNTVLKQELQLQKIVLWLSTNFFNLHFSTLFKITGVDELQPKKV